MERSLWTRDEMILALNLYLKMPFGKMHRGNPEVIKLAGLIGRTPDAVAYRLVNYAACDPQLKQRGVAGMAHGGKKCEAYWDEFVHDRERLLFESERILARYEHIPIEQKYEKQLRNIPSDVVGETRMSQVQTRVNQCLFRQIVLANYDGKCALTGIDLPELLVASHVIPWAVNKQERLNPENGICLSALYDKAFDQGLISFDAEYKTIFSNRLSSCVGRNYYERYFRPIHHQALAVAKKYTLNPEFLAWHRDNIFNK